MGIERIREQVFCNEVEKALTDVARRNYNKEPKDLTNEETYYCLLHVVKDLSASTKKISGNKKIYYISAEFLIGKLLTNNLINLGIYDRVKEILAGYGKNFAAAAWDYGVDPRWSPAISNVESSKGLHCFRSHNAWGWGSSGWSSWEEAIDAHVSGLARGYGSTLTYAAACKYCPPNSRNWYNGVLAGMKSI